MIILAEIGRGGLNQAVIGIEQTKAKLQAAVDELTGPAGSASPRPVRRRRRARPATCGPPRADRPATARPRRCVRNDRYTAATDPDASPERALRLS